MQIESKHVTHYPHFSMHIKKHNKTSFASLLDDKQLGFGNQTLLQQGKRGQNNGRRQWGRSNKRMRLDAFRCDWSANLCYECS